MLVRKANGGVQTSDYIIVTNLCIIYVPDMHHSRRANIRRTIRRDSNPRLYVFYCYFFIFTVYSPPQFVIGFTLSDLLDNPWS